MLWVDWALLGDSERLSGAPWSDAMAGHYSQAHTLSTCMPWCDMESTRAHLTTTKPLSHG